MCSHIITAEDRDCCINIVWCICRHQSTIRRFWPVCQAAVYTVYNMGKASRAIIFENGKMLVMQRNKYGSRYFTLVGGSAFDNETMEQALVREIREETGMEVIRATLVFIEEHPAPYNEQYIYVCEVAPHGAVAVQHTSEEGYMNSLDANVHTPMWIEMHSFAALDFRTPQLQKAILKSLKHGFPTKPLKL